MAKTVMTAEQRAAHLAQVRETEQAERDQRKDWKGRGLMRPVDPKKRR